MIDFNLEYLYSTNQEQNISLDNSRTLLVYQKAVKENFAFLKKTTSFDDLLAKSISLANSQGFLVPISELHTNDEQLIQKLSQWREENTFAYPSQFPVTPETTKTWLRKSLLDIDDRLLFLVLDRFGQPVGHLGLANGLNAESEIEIDNVLRGIELSQPGIMTQSMQALIKWTEEIISPNIISLKVFYDNKRAIEFYQKIGFKESGLIPLRQHIFDDGISYQPLLDGDINSPDSYFVRMVYHSSEIVDTSSVILTAGPSISAREVSYVLDAAKNGWNHQHRDYINRFEYGFADYLGIKKALITNSCTCAMHLALVTLGIGSGDEVIVPDLTWVATANAVMYVGATPIFVDIEPDSWCLDPIAFESAITERTKAVMPVHLYGHPARMDKIMEIARRHHLYVVEDAAPAIGAEVHGQKVATYGDFAAFSFQGAKLLVTGEGGMLVTNNEELYQKAWAIWNQGCLPGTFWVTQNGYKYRMSNLQAAIGLGQLERVDELIEAKRRIFSWYVEGLKNVSEVQLNYETEWARSIYWMSSLYLNETSGLSRDDLRTELKQRNIDTRSVFPAISQYPFWNRKQVPSPNALRVGNQAINLPSGVCLKRAEVNYICNSIKDILHAHRK